MKRPLEIAVEETSMHLMVSLSNAFTGLSSMKIMQTKQQVLTSNQFFSDVWNIYKDIRVAGMFLFGRSPSEQPVQKELYILITASAGLSGDIDQRLIAL